MTRAVRRFLVFPASVALVTVGLLAGSAGPASASTVDPWTWPGTASKGYLPPHEPAVHGGTVKVGLITAGTIHDHGYYQSEVTVIDAYAKKYHWTKVIQGSVATANALSAAENMCSQGVDLLIIGESQLTAATSAATASVCKGTPVWIQSTVDVPLTTAPKPYLHEAITTGPPAIVATGVAMGLWLKAHHQTTAGFVTGPALSFTEGAAQAYLAGMRYVVKNAKLDAVYTGTFTATGPAITATTSMISKGIRLVFPYLGASLFNTAKYVVKHGGAVPSDGGRWCDHQGVKFAIEQSFDPGYLLTSALTEFAHGKMRVGVAQTFALGKTSIPSVSFCPGSGVSSSGQAVLRRFIKNVENHTVTANALVKKTPIPK